MLAPFNDVSRSIPTAYHCLRQSRGTRLWSESMGLVFPLAGTKPDSYSIKAVPHTTTSLSPD